MNRIKNRRKLLYKKRGISFAVVFLFSFSLMLQFTGTALGAVSGKQNQPTLGSTKQIEPSLNDYFGKGMTLNQAKDLLAKGAYQGDSLLIKVTEKADFGVVKLPEGEITEATEIFALPATLNKEGQSAVWYQCDLTVAKGDRTDRETDLAKLMVALDQQEGVLKVEPNFIVGLAKPVKADAVANAEPIQKVNPASKERQFLDQYYLNDYGIPQGWEFLTAKNVIPGEGVIVAVVDSGVDYEHPDLKNQILRKKDGSVWGYDFVDQDDSPLDGAGHGTHVAGIIAGQKNDFGITGVAYGAKIMPIRVLDEDGWGNYGQVIEGMKYAGVQGANVINLSLGGGQSMASMDDLLALLNDWGVLVVAAAGNSFYPNDKVGGEPEYSVGTFASNPSVIGVMATAQNPAANGDRLARFSNWDSVANNEHEYNLMAPGTNIFSTYPDGSYAVLGGTSMAAPMVSGMAACIFSYINHYGIPGQADASNVQKCNYVFSQLAGASDLAQGCTYNGVSYRYPQSNLSQMLTISPEPRLALVDQSSLLIQTRITKVDLDFFLYQGTAKDVAIELIPMDKGVRIVKGPAAVTTLSGGTGFSTSFEIEADSTVASGKDLNFEIKATYKNGRNSLDAKIYTLQKQISVGYFQSITLTQEKLDQLQVLSKEKLWIIPDHLLVKAGKSLKITPGTQLMFTARGSLDVAGNLEIKGDLSYPVLAYAFNEVSAISEVDGGTVTTDYLIIQNPVLAASSVKHTDFSSDNYGESTVLADTISYCNFFEGVYNIYAERMEFCQLANVAGAWSLKAAENNVIIPTGLINTDQNSEDIQLKLAVLKGFSYSLDIEKLKPIVEGDKTFIQYPVAGDAKVDAFMQEYVQLLGGRILPNQAWQKNKQVAEGTKVEISLANKSQIALNATYNIQVWGNKQHFGFTQEFYGLLQKLNSFKNNAILGALNFQGENSKTQRYQLLMDNYWNLENQNVVRYIEAVTKSKEGLDQYLDYNKMLQGDQQNYLADQLTVPPDQIPPFQTEVSFTRNTQAKGFLAAVSEAYDFKISFNTQVRPEFQPILYSYDSDLYVNDEVVKGQWGNKNGKSFWQGLAYIEQECADINLNDVVWAKDAWMVVGKNSRFAVPFYRSVSLSGGKCQSGKSGIILDFRPIKGQGLAGGMDVYREDLTTGKEGVVVKVNKKPVLTGQGEAAGWFHFEDTTAQVGKIYRYGLYYAGQPYDVIGYYDEIALDDRAQVQYALTQEAKADQTVATIAADRVSGYVHGQPKVFKVYYEDGMTFVGGVKSAAIGHRYSASVLLGKDDLGSFVEVTIDPLRDVSIGAQSIISLTFTGGGKLELK